MDPILAAAAGALAERGEDHGEAAGRNGELRLPEHRHLMWQGRLVLDIADKAYRRTKDELRRITRRTEVRLGALVEELNAYIRGARHYVRRVCRRTLGKLDRFVEVRIARWWSRQHSRRRPAWSLVQKGALWRQHGLERWNLPRHLRPADSRRAT